LDPSDEIITSNNLLQFVQKSFRRKSSKKLKNFNGGTGLKIGAICNYMR
jgi:hypothetical protein